MWIITDENNIITNKTEKAPELYEGQKSYEYDGEIPEVKQEPHMIARQTYDGNEFGVVYTPNVDNVKGCILELKRQLKETDHRPLKNWEFEKMGLPPVYDESIYEDRRQWWLEIKQLEKLIQQ